MEKRVNGLCLVDLHAIGYSVNFFLWKATGITRHEGQKKDEKKIRNQILSVDYRCIMTTLFLRLMHGVRMTTAKSDVSARMLNF